MNTQIRLTYLYRDAGNYKAWGSVDFCNPEQLSVKTIEATLRQAFNQRDLFIAHQVGLPELFFYADEPVTEDDHCYHEFEKVEAIESAATDMPMRSISKFVADVETAAEKGWQVFNPADRLPALRANRLSS